MIRYSLSTFRALVSRRYDHNIVGLRYIIIIMDIVIVYIEDTVWRARGLSSLNSHQIRNARNAPRVWARSGTRLGVELISSTSLDRVDSL